MARSFLLVPCLLVCLACVTPFPIENLEEGMTKETVREAYGEPEAIMTAAAVRDLAFGGPDLFMTAAAVREVFGEPEAIETEPGGVNLSWKYLDEIRTWRNIGSFLVPITLISIPICAANPVFPWDCAYVTRRPVLLHFEGEKLARWEVIEPAYSGNFIDPSFQQQGLWSKDMQHHQMGHTHHHGHN